VTDLSDYQLLKTPSVDAPSRQRSIWLSIAVALLVGAAAGAVYVLFFRSPRSASVAVSQAAPPAPASATNAAETAPVVVPPLDETDPVVRKLMEAITSNPQIAAWLATDHLIRRFTEVVIDVAGGATAVRFVPMWRPSSSFHVVPRGRDLIIDPRSYERYDALAAAAASMDPQGSAKVYATLKPRIDEAGRELGDPSFDRSLERAIVLLLSTPDVSDPIRVRPKGVGYAFADPALEALAPAQKQLLRTGPRNVQRFKSSLRAIAIAIGIPESRLPAPTLTH
jgi:hypothetical protein